jgi:hypothetical protein
MIEFDAAMRIATEAANRFSEKGCEEFRVVCDNTILRPYGWIFYVELNCDHEEDDELVGNSPILVLKADGTAIFLGTDCPVDESLRRWESKNLRSNRASK